MIKLHTHRSLLLAAVVGLLSACSGQDDKDRQPPPVLAPAPVEQTPAEKIGALETTHDIPKLDRSASLSGTDADQNGVRDDIDAEIQARISDAAQRRSAVQLAKALQGAVTVDVTNASAVRAVNGQMTNATHCLFTQFTATEGPLGAPAISTFLESITANTKPRLQAYLAFNAALDGTATSLPKGDTCE